MTVSTSKSAYDLWVSFVSDWWIMGTLAKQKGQMTQMLGFGFGSGQVTF